MLAIRPVHAAAAFSVCLAAVLLPGWGCGARTGLEDAILVPCSGDVTCDDGNVCTTDTCVASGDDAGTGYCTHQPVALGTACDDGDACTSDDVCAGGTCAGTPIAGCLPVVDTTCQAGCASGTPSFPAAVPLTPPAVPAGCSGGFEMNNPPTQVFTVQSLAPGGAPASTLDIQIATYKAPDHIDITATDAAGTVTALVATCHLQTSVDSDPTDGCTRPPDDTIRQFTVSLPAGTTTLGFDMTGACTPTYTRVLGLCNFDVTTLFPGCGFRAIP